MKLVLATRKSALAQAQADNVIALLGDKLGILGEKLLIETLGDKRLDVTIDKIGGKGVFVKEIENAILEARADAAVHSMKDVPFQIEECFTMAAIPVREDERDVFIGKLPFSELRLGAIIGTSSLRRAAQLRAVRPDLNIVSVRGNIQTRVSKIELENLDGIILAAAGLKRMGMEDLITDYFDPMEFVPAVGQGAIGVQTMAGSEATELVSKLDIKPERIRIEAERSYMRALNGGCHIPIGAYSLLEGDQLYMLGMFELDGRLIKKDIRGNAEDRVKLGEKLAMEILKG